jgi:hypothetical protein
MESEFKIGMFKILKTSTPHGRTTEEDELGGDTIRELILDNWDQYEKINIYFDGIAKMTRPFVDEAFAKVLESKTLDEFNQKLYFPDASDNIVRDLTQAIKLRMKIMRSQREREDMANE